LQRVDWDELINSGNSLDDLCESFSNVILQAAGESIPNKIITVRKTDPPWMNGAIRRAIRKRNRFKDKRKNQIFQFIGQTSENPGTKLLT
jgi:hypothetical protein